MKVLKTIIQVIVIVMLVLALIGWLLPREVEVYREITINAPADKVYGVVNDLKQMDNWSPWHKIDPEGTTYSFEGPNSGVGMKMSWESDHDQVGTGSQEIVESTEASLVKTEMYFGGFDTPNYATFYMEQIGSGTKVKWDFQGDMGPNPYMHYMSLFMDGMLGESYEQGLSDLKAYVEGLPEEEKMIEDDMEMESDSTSTAMM